ncbi:hypothetical protein [Zavarzinella formosa]|uniref:hypothetical protein n=1 Tax=Zavarzinella formosa TaxID=360055 RepID=UPI00031D6235|nr:hypothetical protein [Zavarzinella formosa]
MDKLAFIDTFDWAAFCREFAQRFVVEDLPTTLRFDFIAANRTPNEKGLIPFLGGRLLTPGQLRGAEPVQARKYLWVDGKIPQWINLSVQAADAGFTFIQVCACQRVTADDRALYHQQEGIPPFHILSPHLPHDWISPEKSGKFSLKGRTAG